MTDSLDPDDPCRHCPDGHRDPNRRPWSAWVTEARDGDGQPTTIHVGPSNGSHLAESDAQWVRDLLNGRASHPGFVEPLDPTPRVFWWPADTLTRRWKPIYRGREERCNRTLGIRVPGGVLFIVTNRRIRTEPCADCAEPTP